MVLATRCLNPSITTRPIAAHDVTFFLDFHAKSIIYPLDALRIQIPQLLFFPLAQGLLRLGYALTRRPIYFQLPYTTIVIFLTPFMFIIPILDTMIDDTSQAITPHYIESFNEYVIKTHWDLKSSKLVHHMLYYSCILMKLCSSSAHIDLRRTICKE